MAWGTITVGRLTLRETVLAEDRTNALTGERTLVIEGQESMPPLLTLAELNQRREDIMGLLGLMVPVRFTDKANLDGYYRVSDVGAGQVNWQAEVAWVNWSLTLELVGPANAVDLESRLTAAGRVNDHGLTASAAWHAPAVSAYGYDTGASSPSGTVSRVGTDGTVTVFLDVPAGVNPRWGSSLADYGGGRCRFTLDGFERTGTNLTVSGSAWSLSNSLVRVSPAASATLSVDAWDSGAWATKSWNVSVAGSGALLGTPSAVTVLRNDYEVATIRLVWDRAPGRAALDLTVRRGSRLVEGYLQTGAANTLAVYRATAEAATAPASSAYVTATGNDADGNRFLVASARSFTALTVQGGLQKTSTRTLDFGVGVVFAGGSAAAGDAATDLRSQYLMAMADTTVGVKR
jgi:hypothetical protein